MPGCPRAKSRPSRPGWTKAPERGPPGTCPKPLKVRTLLREQRPGYRLEKVEIDNGVDAAIPAYLVIPDGLQGRAPAVLLLHWHSGNKEGVLFSSEEQNVLEPLVKRGYILLAIDSYFNGERLGKGPGGPSEEVIAVQRHRRIVGVVRIDQPMADDRCGNRRTQSTVYRLSHP